MNGSPLERLGISANPFRGPSTSALAWHIERATGLEFTIAQGRTLQGGSPCMLAVVGARGSGKTHQLHVAGQRARRAGAFQVMQSLSNCKPDALIARLASALLAGCRLGELSNALASPKWYRSLMPMTRRSAMQGDPVDDGHALARALNANAPAFLFLDDLHTLPIGRAADAYLETLTSLRSHLGSGVLVAWSCDSRHFKTLIARHPDLLDQGFNPIPLTPLRDDEAQALIVARLEGHRIAEGVDPLYPFRPEAVARMNQAEGGNPQRLTRLADLLIETTARGGDFEIDLAAVEDVLLGRPSAQGTSLSTFASRPQ